jgi:predicted Zn-dependent protease
VSRAGVFVVVAAVAACGGGPRFLGGTAPGACRARSYDDCFAAVHDLQRAANLTGDEDRALQRYVQHVVDRLARTSRLAHAPRAVIETTGAAAYVMFGPRIMVSRALLGWIGSEADLAGVLAHELAHLEGRHAGLASTQTSDPDRWYQARRDAEGLADERSTELLVRAGYPADALVRLYERQQRNPERSIHSDDEHPSLEVSIPRLRALVAGHTGGFEGRAELLRASDGTITGHDTRLGTRVHDAWVVARLGLALPIIGEIDEGWAAHRMAKPDGSFGVGLVSGAWGSELAGALEERRTVTTSIGEVTLGIMPALPVREHDVIARMLDGWRDEVNHPSTGVQVAVIRRDAGALLVELAAQAPAGELERVVRTVRRATGPELAEAEPIRIRLATARVRGSVRDQALQCVDPEAALDLDDPDRVIEAGAPFKCTDRALPPELDAISGAGARTRADRAAPRAPG